MSAIPFSRVKTAIPDRIHTRSTMNNHSRRPVGPSAPQHSDCTPETDFESILAARLSRRDFVRGSAGTGAMALLGGLTLGTLAACSEEAVVSTPAAPVSQLLGFKPVAKSLADAVAVPEGYRYSILCALGDPLAPGLAPYGNTGNDTDFENRFGDHHDGMEYFGLSASGTPDPASSTRALIGLNHEATTNEGRPSFFLHADGGTQTLPRPPLELDKEMAIHGIAVFEINRVGDTFVYLQDSPFNFRIHQNTDVEIYGPLRGNPLAQTRYSPAGTNGRGTLNNCGTGRTPWGTLLSGEENWAGYFTRNGNDDAARGDDSSVASLNRYGLFQGNASRHGWEGDTTNPARGDRYQRWDVSVLGETPQDDYRNELNTMGYIVEVDPYDKTRKTRKRTALGRFAHEAAAFSVPTVGSRLAVYQGDDARNEYIYKWVSTANWSAEDASAADRLAVGDKYLDAGTLYAARFNADGSGEWVALTIDNPVIAAYAGYAFADQADVCINSRLAGDAVGATRMDRPEWSSVNPANGEIYITLTNNITRRLNPGDAQTAPDAANPRVYDDQYGTDRVNTGNPNGHVIRIREDAGDPAATTFTWDVYLFGAEAGTDPAVNLSSLTDDQDFSSPDGLMFAPSTGILWLQTDDSYYTDVTNSMMLAALPGQVGDGDAVVVPGTGVTTWRGKSPTAQTLKRFLVGTPGSEITGICETPDGTALFVNIQHPGETTAHDDIEDPARYTSHWPGNAGYGAGGDMARPRSATIVITREDGGQIGY